MSERGVVLLEVLLAVSILGMVGVTSVGYLAATIRSQSRLHDREVEMTRAERVLAATALLSRAELEQRIGVRESAGFAVWVDRPESGLFRIGVAPYERPSAEILSTLVYRSESTK